MYSDDSGRIRRARSSLSAKTSAPVAERVISAVAPAAWVTAAGSLCMKWLSAGPMPMPISSAIA